MPRPADRLWHGRHGSSPCASMIPDSGLRGAQCQGLVRPKIPTLDFPSAAATCRQIIRYHGARRCQAQNSIAQVGSGEIAHTNSFTLHYLIGDVLFMRPSEHPDIVSPLDEPSCQPGKILCRPSLRCSDRTWRKRDCGTRVAGNLEAAPPRGDFRNREFQLGQGPRCREVFIFFQGERRTRSTMRGSRRSPKRKSLINTRRCLADKAGALGMPARQWRQRGLSRCAA